MVIGLEHSAPLKVKNQRLQQLKQPAILKSPSNSTFNAVLLSFLTKTQSFKNKKTKTKTKQKQKYIYIYIKTVLSERVYAEEDGDEEENEKKNKKKNKPNKNNEMMVVVAMVIITMMQCS